MGEKTQHLLYCESKTEWEQVDISSGQHKWREKDTGRNKCRRRRNNLTLSVTVTTVEERTSYAFFFEILLHKRGQLFWYMSFFQ